MLLLPWRRHNHFRSFNFVTKFIQNMTRHDLQSFERGFVWSRTNGEGNRLPLSAFLRRSLLRLNSMFFIFSPSLIQFRSLILLLIMCTVKSDQWRKNNANKSRRKKGQIPCEVLVSSVYPRIDFRSSIRSTILCLLFRTVTVNSMQPMLELPSLYTPTFLVVMKMLSETPSHQLDPFQWPSMPVTGTKPN